jgi:hypothetical protein
VRRQGRSGVGAGGLPGVHLPELQVLLGADASRSNSTSSAVAWILHTCASISGIATGTNRTLFILVAVSLCAAGLVLPAYGAAAYFTRTLLLPPRSNQQDQPHNHNSHGQSTPRSRSYSGVRHQRSLDQATNAPARERTTGSTLGAKLAARARNSNDPIPPPRSPQPGSPR